MASITQTIPSYNNGISQQPDHAKRPGQLVTAKNVMPDLVEGLMKRPGGKLIKSLSDGSNNSVTNGRWFHYYRDENEQYIGQISRTGIVKIWSCIDGAEKTVTYDSGTATLLTNYLTHSNDEDLQTLTLNDYTYVVNRTKTVAMDSTTAPARPSEAYIELKKVSYASQYALNLFNNTNTTTSRTATRIEVELVKSSNNYCGSSGGMVGRTSRPSQTTRCDDTAGDGRDAWCPNIATRIFACGSGTALVDTDSVSGAYNYNVSVNNSGATGRSNLYFRISTIGQSVPYTSGTGNDQVTTYQCRYTTTHDLLYGGEGWYQGDYFYVWMKDGYYKVTITEVSTSEVQANLGLIRPTPTPFDAKTTVTAESILGALQEDIIATSEFDSTEVQIIGNGIYLTNGTAFNVSSPTGELLNVVTNEVNDITDLPTQCKNGYVVKIKNSAANEDDHFVRFDGEHGRDGPGVWTECPQPGRKITIDQGTMPIEIVRQADGSFTVDQILWDSCNCGNTTTVPEPSFVGQKINKMIFFRNRMVMLSDEDVVLSRPGDFYNFWPRSAITYTATDVIDVSCSSEKPAIVWDGIQVNSGLVLFTKTKQFLLSTDSDVLSPQTAKINALASYNFNYKTNPISLGTTIGFLDNAGKYSRFWEVARILREGEPIVVDQTKVVSKLFDKELELISNSRENGYIFFSKKGTKTLYGYKYFNSSDKRLQQAWFTWELMGDIQHHAVLDDALFVVVRNGGKDVLQKFSLKIDDGEYEISDNQATTSDATDDVLHRIHLDNATAIASSSLSAYDEDNDRTVFTVPDGFNNSSGQLAVYVVPSANDLTFQGRSENVSTFVESGVTKVSLPGNWKTYDPQYVEDGSTGDEVTPANNIILGYQFDMEVEFPTIYYQQPQGDQWVSLINGSLVVHRVKLNLGANGLYETTIKRLGKPDYTETWEPTIANAYSANRVQINEEATQTIPTYEKNKNLTLQFKSTHPTPATLYSMTWEGDYTTQNYRRV